MNLWVEDLNIKNTNNLNTMLFYDGYRSDDNVLTFVGNNTLIVEDDGTTNKTGDFTAATINVGNGLIIQGQDSASLTVKNISEDRLTGGAAIGVNKGMGAYNIPISIGSGVTINAEAMLAAAIGAGGQRSNTGSTVGDITIGDGANVTAYSEYGCAIGKGYDTNNNSTAENVYISTSATVNASSNQQWANPISPAPQYVNKLVNVNVTEPKLGETTTTHTVTKTITTYVDDPNAGGAPMSFQFGAKANQSLNFFVEDMHTKSLGTKDLLDADGNFLNEEDEDRFYALSYNQDLQSAWLDTVTKAQNQTIDDIDVKTQVGANIAVRVLDGAIDYALNQATTLGASLQRLDYSAANITTMSENVQASESTIRDADMAKSMTDYTKANVLVQSAQSMLAQANQQGSAVLSLLQ